jgi:hypothetical protein
MLLQRLALSGGIILVSAMSAWTERYLNPTQGLCIALLAFVIFNQEDDRKQKNGQYPEARLSLAKRVCILYCNRQVRGLFIIKDNNPVSIFADIMLAIMLAALTIFINDRNSRGKPNINDIKQMLESLLYLYGDILDSAFQYGVLKITICAFGVSMALRTLRPPEAQMLRFCWRMASIISSNLLSEGITTLMPSADGLKLIQILATVCILRLILPDMEYYLIYLAAQQLTAQFPGAAALLFCVVICLDFLPNSSHEWIGQLCFTYIMIAVAMYVSWIPAWGMIFILVMVHYIEHIMRALS